MKHTLYSQPVIGLWSCLLMAGILLASCGRQVHKPSSFVGFSVRGDEAAGMVRQCAPHMFDAAAEHNEILGMFGGTYSHPVIQKGIERMVAQLVRFSDKPDVPHETFLLNSPAINAFVLPGGRLYLTRGLLALINDEDELAAVLAHEIGHLTACHSVKRHREVIKVSALGRIPDVDGLIAGFSRRQELEADRIGALISTRAGFDPFASVSLLTSILRDINYRKDGFDRNESHMAEISFENHQPVHPAYPAPRQRIRSVRNLVQMLGIPPGQRVRRRASYLKMIDGMIYGDDPRDGYVRGRSFLHPGLKIAFSVPENFVLHNAQDAVFVIGPDDVVIRFDGVSIGHEDSALENYVRSSWGQGVVVKSLDRTTDNNLPVVYAEARYNGLIYLLAAVRADTGNAFRFLLARHGMTKEIERNFALIVRSFRRLSRAETARLRPLRLRVLTVRKGRDGRFDHIVRQMQGQEEHVRLLNGLEDDEPLHTGQMIKIIVDR